MNHVTMTEQEKTDLLDWVSACQSAYHIESTPNHRFGGLPGMLQENREALVEYVQSLLDDRDAALAGEMAALRIAAKRDSDEPFFTLLGRDPQAPALVRQWADERQRLDPASDKPGTARLIAASMEFFKQAHPDKGFQAKESQS